MRILSKAFVFILFLSFVSGASLAAPEHAVSGKEDTAKQKTEDSDLVYLPITRATLSQLYWRMGAYEVSNDIDVDNFMMLNKCDLYKKFYRDDFQWHKIRIKAQKSLEKNIKTFPTRLAIIQPIHLNRYNFKEQAFPLTYPIDTRRFEVKADEEWPCEKVAASPYVWKYPHHAIVNFSNPVSVYSIPVVPKIAKEYNKLYSNASIHSARPAISLLNSRSLTRTLCLKRCLERPQSQRYQQL